MGISESLFRLAIFLDEDQLQKMAIDDLYICLDRSYMLKNEAESAKKGVSQAEIQLANHLYEMVLAEFDRRGVNVFPVQIELSENGDFVKGYAELKEMFSHLDFDSMVEIADNIMSNFNNEAQRRAIIDLEREMIYNQA